MDTTLSVNIALPGGVTYDKVRMVQAIIKGDVGGTYENFRFVSDGYRATVITNDSLYAVPVVIAGSHYINVGRDATNSLFDSTDFDATSFNRGYVTVIYEA
jgi:hypothetical protein